MTRAARLRRVVRVCLHCMSNLAYYRAGWQKGALIPNGSQFWKTVNGNCLDQCVLEWCKLFGKKDPHCWRKIVSNPAEFESDLLRHLTLDMGELKKFVDQMQHYRDKFVAHLDSDEIMDIPKLDIPKASTWFYYTHVVTKEAQQGEISGFEPYMDLTRYYELCEDEAKRVYRTFM